MTYFEHALQYLFENEGIVFTNDPLDSGGPTKFGVTLSAYSDFLKKEVTPEEIQALTLEEIKPFYFEQYWLKSACDKMKDASTAIAIFDTCCLYGVNTTGRAVQKTLGFVRCDGILGPDSLRLLNQENPNSFLDWFNFRVKQLIESILYRNPKNEKFREGWMKRADRMLTLKALVPG